MDPDCVRYKLILLYLNSAEISGTQSHSLQRPADHIPAEPRGTYLFTCFSSFLCLFFLIFFRMLCHVYLFFSNSFCVFFSSFYVCSVDELSLLATSTRTFYFYIQYLHDSDFAEYIYHKNFQAFEVSCRSYPESNQNWLRPRIKKMAKNTL